MAKNFDLQKDSIRNVMSGMAFNVLNALRELGGSGDRSEIADKVVELEFVSEAEQKLMMKDKSSSKFIYYLSWTFSYLKKAGCLENSARSIWSITSQGDNISSFEEAYRLMKSTIKNYSRDYVRKEKTSKAQTEDIQIVASNAEDKASDLQQDDAWKEELLTLLLNISPGDFEKISQKILRNLGFESVYVTGKTGDGGIDGEGIYKINSLLSVPIVFQCKRWREVVGSSVVRDFRGAVQGRAERGLIITTGNFTKSAKEEASRKGALLIDLVDGDTLCELFKKAKIGLKVEQVEKLSVDTNWFENNYPYLKEMKQAG